ncbi:MAG: Gfo/Idh/MocA family oxidoreductase, partial [Verrucomicrobiae bacterium]|nr:Gfo/Idh/MocA family oxidoreductase [Verrucomicrobiae bacterium]
GLISHGSSHQLMVGFNRRFSPHTMKIKELLEGRSEPLAMTMTVNAGFIPPDHWVHDPVRGGGRVIGEACHFIDLMVYLTGSPVKNVAAVMMSRGTATPDDKISIALEFEDGSVGTINYFANGPRSYPKETLEVFSEGRVVRLENFRRTIGFGFKRFRKFWTWRQDKGHTACFEAFLRRVAEGGPALVPISELVNVTLASFAAVVSARERRVVEVKLD